MPAVSPRQLGDPAFLATYGLDYAYMAGSMANGISSAEMVIALGKAGMLGAFGAGGMVPQRLEAAIQQIQQALAQAGEALADDDVLVASQVRVELIVADVDHLRHVNDVRYARPGTEVAVERAYLYTVRVDTPITVVSCAKAPEAPSTMATAVAPKRCFIIILFLPRFPSSAPLPGARLPSAG